MSVAVVTGSSGLIGSEAAIYFGALGLDIVGVDNDMRRAFFGPDASTDWNRSRVQEKLGRATSTTISTYAIARGFLPSSAGTGDG